MTSASGEKRSQTDSETPHALHDGYEPSTESMHANVSDSSPRQDWGNEESPRTVDRPRYLHSSLDPSMHEIVITTIRVTDAALGLRRLPAGFNVVVHHSDLEWRTENKRSSVGHDVVEWGGPIPMPLDLSATIRLEVYGSFEFQPVLGAGEQLRKLTTTIEELLDRSANDIPFTFFPKDGDVVSPCSSIFVTVERRSSQRDGSSSSSSPHRLTLTTKSQGNLEGATNHGHSALSHYRKYGGRHNLEKSIRHFEHALIICPQDHPCHAVVQSNLAMAKLLHYQVENTSTSLELPLRLYRDALAARPVGHPDRPSTLIQLAMVHLVQFQKRGNNSVGEEQVEALLHEAMELSSTETHENRIATFMFQLHTGRRVGPLQPNAQYLKEQGSTSRMMSEDLWVLSDRLLKRFQRFGDLADLQQAITLLEGLVRSTPPLDDWYCEGLDRLGVALMERFNHLGNLSDIDAAISVLRDVVGLTYGQPDEPQHLHNLGTALLARFRRLGEPSDLEGAISSFRDAVDLTPSGHPRKRLHLNNLGTSIFFRFARFGELTALEDAISRQSEAVDLTPHGHPERPGYLINLGNSLRIRFEQLGELSDLENATSMLRNAINLTPDDHPERPGRLNNLGTSLATCFERLGRIGDLDDAISILKEGVNLAPEGHPDKLICLNNLGNSLRDRFVHLGQISDLEDAISRQRDVVDLAPDGHPNKPSYLSSLGSSFGIRFKRLGELSDLENAILMQNKGVNLIPDGHPNKPSHLHNLGTSFAIRFQHLGQAGDLENAISRQMDAVNLTPHGHPDKHRYLNTLGITFTLRFKLLGELSDIKDGMSMLSDAIDLIPHSHPDKPLYLDNLGSSFVTCFEYFGELTDLEHAISRQKDAVDLVPRGHPERPDYLSRLSVSLKLRFERLREPRDLEDAISREMDAVDLTPHGHPHKLTILDNLGTSFRTRFECLGELINLEQAISLHSHAASAPVGPINARFRASLNWISCARHIRHHSLLHAYSISVGLLPQLAWIGLPLMQRYSELLRGADVVRDAAAAALESGFPETAVEWLEQGRSIVWGELLQLRSSHEELSSAYPDHARRLQELSAALDIASAAHEKSLSALSEQAQDIAHRLTDPQQVADEHRILAIERDELLQEVRRLPGFEGFLRHKTFSSLHASAHSGPVVILNAAESRCDALIVLDEVNHIIHVPLPNFTLQRADNVRNTMKGFVRYARDGKRIPEDAIGWEHVLPPLWKSVVKPVLDALAVLIPGDLLRIFWCPTGPFVFLPIHAAGLYDRQYSEPGNKVFDFVVSSYVPTLAILTLSSSPANIPNGNLRILAVPQPPSDGQARLPGVVTELNHVRTVISNSPSARTTFLESSVGTVEEVISLMKHADWVHFACHGVQDNVDSGLCLANGRRLKLRDIVALSRPRGGLAFLSACQTAMGEKHLSDEAIHVAAGMLFAGYGGVVGTMWSISDRLAPIVARDVYEYLFRDGTRPDYREAARALHEALTGLRDNGEVSFAEWVPFIHVGL